jgi:ABC-type transport system substrate-binding protein
MPRHYSYYLSVPRIAMLKTDEADVISVSRERAPELESQDFNIFTKSRWSVLGMYLHEQWRPELPISKLKVQQALNLAVNRQVDTCTTITIT